MPFKIIISDPEEGEAWQVEKEATPLIGSKIGEEFNGDLIDLNGYTLKITGGSDKDGFPMRKRIEGQGRSKVLMKGGPGYRPKENGVKSRKSVRGNTLSEEIVQINTKIVDRESDVGSVLELLGLEQPEEESGEEAETEEVTKEEEEGEGGEESKETGAEGEEGEGAKEAEDTEDEDEPEEESEEGQDEGSKDEGEQ